MAHCANCIFRDANPAGSSRSTSKKHSTNSTRRKTYSTKHPHKNTTDRLGPSTRNFVILEVSPDRPEVLAVLRFHSKQTVFGRCLPRNFFVHRTHHQVPFRERLRAHRRDEDPTARLRFATNLNTRPGLCGRARHLQLINNFIAHGHRML